MTKVPRAVVEASRLANKLHEEAYPQTDTPGLTLKAPNVHDEEGEEGTPVQDASPETPVQPTPQPTPPAQTQVEPAPSPDPEGTVDYWRDKYRTLEGKYRAEVPRAAQDLRDARARISSMEATLAAMSSPTLEKPLVSSGEIEEYGEDFVDLMRRVAKEEAGRAVGQVAPRIDSIAGQLQETTAQTQIERVYALLDANIPNWRTINRSEAFVRWLQAPVPYTGKTRVTMLREAFDFRDGPTVLSFFTGYLDENARQAPEQTPDQAPPVSPHTTPARVQPKVTLDQLTGPRSVGGSVSPTPSNGTAEPTWTRRQIAAFYADVRAGKFKLDPSRQREIEMSINRAVNAGKVAN